MRRTLTILSAILAITLVWAHEPWRAPAEADNMVNPVAGDAKATAKGQRLYDGYCWTCHGARGKGDGPAADKLQAHPSDLGSQTVQKQTDGAIFWKLSNGRGEMVAYKQSLSDNQRWAIVNHIRTLKE